jgi:DNA-binding NarL/FixJ family response regulator
MGERERAALILTPRQLAVARLLHEGYHLKQVAATLGISIHTARAHCRVAAARIGWRGDPTSVLAVFYERFHVPRETPPLLTSRNQ